MSHYNLDPALAAYVAESAMFACTEQDMSARRHAFAEACAYFTRERPAGLKIEGGEVNGIAIRIYSPARPAPEKGWPTVLYFHGGGWSMGSHTTHDWFAFGICRRVNVAVVALNYRLAPEHPFPAPLEDGLEVWKALRRGDFPQLNRECLAVAGDSAGGSLAAGLCVALRDDQQTQPDLQVLAYPVLSAKNHLASMRLHADAPMLTTAGLLASLEGFLPTESLKNDPRAMPLEADDLSGLAPAFIGVAEYDPLFDHGAMYAQRLKAAGNPVSLYVGEGLVHASLRALGVSQVEGFYNAMSDSLQDMVWRYSQYHP